MISETDFFRIVKPFAFSLRRAKKYDEKLAEAHRLEASLKKKGPAGLDQTDVGMCRQLVKSHLEWLNALHDSIRNMSVEKCGGDELRQAACTRILMCKKFLPHYIEIVAAQFAALAAEDPKEKADNFLKAVEKEKPVAREFADLLEKAPKNEKTAVKRYLEAHKASYYDHRAIMANHLIIWIIGLVVLFLILFMAMKKLGMG